MGRKSNHPTREGPISDAAPKRVGHGSKRSDIQAWNLAVVDGLYHPHFASSLSADSDPDIEQQPGFRNRQICGRLALYPLTNSPIQRLPRKPSDCELEPRGVNSSQAFPDRDFSINDAAPELVGRHPQTVDRSAMAETEEEGVLEKMQPQSVSDISIREK